MKLPADTGYSVNRETRTIHTRHPGAHAGKVQRVRSSAGVESALGGRKGSLCQTCYPGGTASPDVVAPSSGQVRRSGKGDDDAASMSDVRNAD